MQGGKYSVFYEANVRTNTRKSANPTRSYQRISQIHEPHSRESLRNSQKIYEFRRFLNEEVRTLEAGLALVGTSSQQLGRRI